ncbi:MAG: SDR family oxidoreductase [Bacteroidota bacterium]
MTPNKKIALVTGGSRGLGKNMAISLATKGLYVIITYNSQEGEALAVVKQVEALGSKALAIQLNTADTAGFDVFFKTLEEKLHEKFNTRSIDFLVNNAGVGVGATFAGTSEEQFNLLMNVHFKGVFFLAQKALAMMNDGGGIVNLSTGLARFYSPGYTAYAAMKGAVEVLTRYQAKELGPRGIRVNTVAPGAIETDFAGGIVRDNPQVNEHIAGITALGRVGLPDDIGGVVSFLCTEDARWINGQRIEVSGGMNL